MKILREAGTDKPLYGMDARMVRSGTTWPMVLLVLATVIGIATCVAATMGGVG